MKPATKGVLIGGGFAATFDIIYAYLISARAGVSPTWVPIALAIRRYSRAEVQP
jgi:hypothetical protein